MFQLHTQRVGGLHLGVRQYRWLWLRAGTGYSKVQGAKDNILIVRISG